MTYANHWRQQCARIDVERGEGAEGSAIVRSGGRHSGATGHAFGTQQAAGVKANLVAAGRLLIATTSESAWREGEALPLAQAIEEATAE